MTYLRFLRAGARDPFTGATWSRSQWVAPPRGVVAYRQAELPRWLANELWTVAIDGPAVVRRHSVVAARGKLIEPVASWDVSAAADFVAWLVERYPTLPYTPTRDGWTPAWEAAYVAAHFAGMDAEASGAPYAYAEEQEWGRQAGWLATRLNLASEL